MNNAQMKQKFLEDKQSFISAENKSGDSNTKISLELQSMVFNGEGICNSASKSGSKMSKHLSMIKFTEK